MNTVVEIKFGRVPTIFLRETPNAWQPYLRRKLLALLKLSKTHKEFATRLGISPLVVRRLLDLLGVDYVQRLNRQYKKGKTCSDIANANGMKPATLSKLFRERGFEVQRGVRRPKVPIHKLRRIWTETQVIDRVAQKFKIHWKTALHLLEEEKLIVDCKGRPRKLSKSSRPP
ncbi:hypothetical protein ABLN87_13050 [Ruegeria sp. SCPT10]|uniref:hypothetical protein n=1 Tax=Ruegeria sp. SCP10 TaxID=3141377 RepID=UPI003338BE12